MNLLLKLRELKQLFCADQLRLLHAQVLHRLQPRPDAHVEAVQLLLHRLHDAGAGHRRLVPATSVTLFQYSNAIFLSRICTHGSGLRLVTLLATSSSLMLLRRLINEICSNFSSMNSASELQWGGGVWNSAASHDGVHQC